MSPGRGRSVAKALAELVLIVAGVLIALLVDEWRDEQADRDREVMLLEAVQSNLVADSLFIAKYAASVPVMNAGLRRMWELDPDDLPPDATLDSLLLATSRYITDLWTTTAFTGIEQTGDLRLIRNPALVGALTHYYKDLIPRAVGQNALDRSLNVEFGVNQGWGVYGIERPRGDVADVLESESPLEAFGVSRPEFRRWLRDRRGYLAAREASLALVRQSLLNVEEARGELSRQITEYLELR